MLCAPLRKAKDSSLKLFSVCLPFLPFGPVGIAVKAHFVAGSFFTVSRLAPHDGVKCRPTWPAATSWTESEVSTVKKSLRKMPSLNHLLSRASGSFISGRTASNIRPSPTLLQWSGITPNAPQIGSRLPYQVWAYCLLAIRPSVVPEAPLPIPDLTTASAASCSSSSVVGGLRLSLSSQSARYH